MTRILTLLAILTGLMVGPAWADEAAAEQVPPNVVVIMVDDMRVDDLAAMPKTRRLLGADGAGATYTNAYATLPLCCPSRATFLTGQHPHNHNVLNNSGGPTGAVDALDDTSTLPVWLQASGYRTAMFGKYLNGYGNPEDGTQPNYVPPGWSDWSALAYETRSNYTDFDLVTGSSTADAPGVGVEEHVRDGYQTRKLTSLAVNQIKDTDEPLFMWLSLYAPHRGRGDGPQQYVPAEPKYAGASKAGMPQSPAVNELKIGDKPSWISRLPRLSSAEKSQILQHRRERRDALRTVDDSVVRVIDTLRQKGELGNTVIMFTSDNGYMQGEHRIRLGKTNPYLESARVPLLIRGSELTPGRHGEPVSNIDLAPTIADLAGVTPGLVVDGMTLLGPIPADRPILLENPEAFDPRAMPAYSGVIQGGWEYVEYTSGRELYDLDADPWQQWNRIANPKLRPERIYLAGLLNRLRDCAGEQCRG